jgi:hypothetical protein
MLTGIVSLGRGGCFRSVTRNSLTRNKWLWFVDLCQVRNMRSVVIRLALCLASTDESAHRVS